MIKPRSICLLVGVALLCLAIQPLVSKPHSPEATRAANLGFGLRIAGTWLGEYVAYLPEPTPLIFGLNTVHADGTGLVTSPELHGNGSPELFGLRSPLHYSWVRTGPQSIAWTGLFLAMDKDGNLGAPPFGAGSLIRMSGESEYDEDFQVFTGTAMTDVFTADQDPLDPSETPIGSFPITFEYKRLNVQ